MHYQKILLTTDLSENSYRAFESAAYASKMEGSEIRLVYVCQYFQDPVMAGEVPLAFVVKDYCEAMQNSAQTKLEELAKHHFHNQKVIVDAVLSAETPGDTISRYAREHNTELIVIAGRGQSALRGLLLGSTVQQILMRAPCPVLVVPAQQEL